jgi:hypothetical protein
MKATTISLDLEDWFAIWTESMGNKVPWLVVSYRLSVDGSRRLKYLKIEWFKDFVL